MLYETWNRIFLLSAALTLLFLTVTVIMIVKFRFFSLLRFRKENKSRDNYIHTSAEIKIPASSEENFSGTESLSDSTECIRRDDNNEICRETVVIPQNPEISGTVVISDEFRLKRNTIIIHADPSVIRKITDTQ